MADDVGIAGLEQPPQLQVLPTLYGHGDDALACPFRICANPDQFTILFVYLEKRGQVGTHVVLSGVASLETVEIVSFDFFHQIQLGLDLLLG